MKPKLIRITTVPISMDKLLYGQLSYMSDYYDITAISSDETYLKKVGEREGVATHAIEMSREITPIKDLLALIALVRLLKREKPLIVHSHTPKAGIVGMLAAKIAKVPFRLHTVAGMPLMEATGLKRKILNVVEQLTYACASHVYPNSVGLKDIIVNMKFCNPHKLKVLGNGSSNGINTHFFNPDQIPTSQTDDLRKQYNIADSDFVFVFVGRLVKDKGINELVIAFEQVQKFHAHAKLLLVGHYENELDPLFPKTVALINQNESIISVGFQTDVRPYLKLSNILVFPSYREGFPNVVMQAGAMGLPCIVTNINGCNEIITEGVNGTIIPVKNEMELKIKMQLYIENPELYLSQKVNARLQITSRYDQKVIWEAIHQEYCSLT